jgi:hypothetical protein
MKEKIQLAISGRRLIEFMYDGRRRVVEPHDYGIRGGVEKLLAYQVRGDRGSGRVPGWRELEVSKVSGLVVLDETFPGSRGRDHHDHKDLETLFARVR